MTMHFPQNASEGSRALTPALKRQILRARGPLIATVLIASVAALAWSLWQWHRIERLNAAITSLAAGDDASISNTGHDGEVLLARMNLLLARDRFDDAQAVIDQAKPRASAHVMSRMLYNQANSNVRRAFAAIEASKPDAAIPLTKLAKDAYREALRLDPMLWNGKHNYDVATRLMRDFPGYEQEGEEVPPEAEVKLWTDLPGVPQGAP